MISIPKTTIGRIARYTACIAFALLCTVSTIDTGLFVYPSLSRYLLLEVGFIVLTGISILYCRTDYRRMLTSRYTVFILAWIAYISFHTLFISPHEIYRTLYLVVTLSSILVLGACLRQGLLSNKNIENGLMLIAAIHIMYMQPRNLE